MTARKDEEQGMHKALTLGKTWNGWHRRRNNTAHGLRFSTLLGPSCTIRRTDGRQCAVRWALARARAACDQPGPRPRSPPPIATCAVVNVLAGGRNGRAGKPEVPRGGCYLITRMAIRWRAAHLIRLSPITSSIEPPTSRTPLHAVRRPACPIIIQSPPGIPEYAAHTTGPLHRNMQA